MDTQQQIIQLLKESSNILFCLPHHPPVDAIASALVFSFFVEAENKHAAILGENITKETPAELLFGSETILPTLPGLKQLVIRINTTKTPLAEFSYDTQEDFVNIFLDPETGSFSKNDISINEKKYKYDLIITLGCSNLTSLGNAFSREPDFFYSVPIINIDYKPTNERFGRVNHIPLSMNALSEITFDLIPLIYPHTSFDSVTASTLTTGILSATNGLRSSHITPQLLKKVSTLLSFDVDIPTINKKLFHSKSLSMLKLWGRVLARLNEHRESKLVWSLIPHDDFIKTQTTPDDVPQIIDEFISSYSQADIILFLWEYNNSISGLVKTTYRYNALDLTASFSGQGSADMARFIISEPSLLEAEQIVVEQIKKRTQEMHT